GLDAQSDGVYVISRPHNLGLFLHHRAELVDRDVRDAAHLRMFTLELFVQAANFFAVRVLRHSYIRIGGVRSHAGGGGGRGRRGREEAVGEEEPARSSRPGGGGNRAALLRARASCATTSRDID